MDLMTKVFKDIFPYLEKRNLNIGQMLMLADMYISDRYLKDVPASDKIKELVNFYYQLTNMIVQYLPMDKFDDKSKNVFIAENFKILGSKDSSKAGPALVRAAEGRLEVYESYFEDIMLIYKDIRKEEAELVNAA